jgi:rubrerythrin
MELDLTSLEVLEMAQWIESRAAKYYRLLAARVSSSATRQMLLNLAQMEDEHEKTFSALKDIFDPGQDLTHKDSALYTRVIARMTLDVDSILADVMTGQESPEQTASKAIDFEKSTIVFMVSLKSMLSSDQDRRKVDRIIQEEVGHILALSGYLYPAGTAPFQATDGRYAEEQSVLES